MCVCVFVLGCGEVITCECVIFRLWGGYSLCVYMLWRGCNVCMLSLGCVEVAEAFRVQEIDGQALLLLTEDHLMTSMNIKLGPALKICAHINTLRH